MGDMGLALPEEAQAIAKKVQAEISPWLWVLSIVSFGLGLINTHRVRKMYRSWQGKHKG